MNGIMLARRSLSILLSRSQPLARERHRIDLIQTRFCAYLAMQERVPFSRDFLFRQMFDEKSWTYSYLLADTNTKEAVIIDPGMTYFAIPADSFMSYSCTRQ
jgi:hypothetical protein